jgi:hypothetical protein
LLFLIEHDTDIFTHSYHYYEFLYTSAAISARTRHAIRASNTACGHRHFYHPFLLSSLFYSLLSGEGKGVRDAYYNNPIAPALTPSSIFMFFQGERSFIGVSEKDEQRWRWQEDDCRQARLFRERWSIVYV